jgi:exoribonuclease-2
MNVLFEEDGVFRAGTVLADNTSTLQVELPTGKRGKIKAASILLRFDAPAPAELMTKAETAAAGIPVDFLWEVSPEAEFGFDALAVEYVGHKPDAIDAAAVLMRLHSAPMYFHRKGKGRYRKAPPEILQAALAGLEKKKAQAAAIEQMGAELCAGRLPKEFAPVLRELLYKPDRNKPETKALESACAASGRSAVELLAACGAISDTHDYHLGRFLFEFFPRGTDFPACAVPEFDSLHLPKADVAAFSIDDAHTTEIDDAFSVTPLADGGMRVGIHIAAPGLGFAPDSALGRIARERLSTVYMPGRKLTMLPETVVEQFTLAAGHSAPAVSLYLDVAADLRVTGSTTRLEIVPVVANLRHHDIEPVFNAATLASGELPDFPFRDELRRLWELATVLEAGRGASGQQNRKDYSYLVDWEVSTALGPGRISLSERARGSPLDTLVAELMIFANAAWGAQLRDAGVAALYRVQTAGKVRMSTVAGPHEGMGVEAYAWASSPLRRYCDLLNQWQLIALLQEKTPPFTVKSGEFLGALRDFELTYAAYAEFQRGMERYWCLRWLAQEGVTVAAAHVLKESLVRLAEVPLVLRATALPALERGAHVRVAIEDIDLLAAEGRARYLELLEADTSDEALEGGEAGE